MTQSRTLVGGAIPTTFAPCSIHETHRPEPYYCEEHHVIPQAWQQWWSPARKGILRGNRLWDPRTAVLCRTAHGNVHFLLVRFMRAWHELDQRMPLDSHPSIEMAVRQVRVGFKGTDHRFSMKRPEVLVARLAMERWQDAGGDLRALGDADYWGEI